MTTTSIRGRILRRQLTAYLKMHENAKRREENEIFLTLCRFRIAEIEAAIKREQERLS